VLVEVSDTSGKKRRLNCWRKIAITGQCLPIFHSGSLEFAYFGEDFGEPVGELWLWFLYFSRKP
jgi:hypothetical protein